MNADVVIVGAGQGGAHAAMGLRSQKFEGTILLVTHDQDLLEEVGTRVWQFENGRIVDFKGTYEELTSSLA